jgi:hypothetical protein
LFFEKVGTENGSTENAVNGNRAKKNVNKKIFLIFQIFIHIRTY